ncbi:MAG TPA: hypothetical protein VHH91_05750 [Vicinamibacterales bacterium]|nr:hypothetical protein [Vicinamibacterales bacterium]
MQLARDGDGQPRLGVTGDGDAAFGIVIAVLDVPAEALWAAWAGLRAAVIVAVARSAG